MIIGGTHTETQPRKQMNDRIKTRLATEHKTFERQMKEVEQKYPLVALAFYLNELAIAEITTNALSETVSISSQSTTISKVAEQIEGRMLECRRKLRNEMARAKTDEEAINVYKNFVKCWHGQRPPG